MARVQKVHQGTEEHAGTPRGAPQDQQIEVVHHVYNLRPMSAGTDQRVLQSTRTCASGPKALEVSPGSQASTETSLQRPPSPRHR